jgi:hypothetical protein
VLTIFLLIGCSDSKFGFGYSYVEAPHLNGRGLFLMKKNKKNENELVSDTVYMQRRVEDNYFVGVGLPIEIIMFSCTKGGEGFNYKIKNIMNFVVINMATNERKNSSSFDELYSFLSSKEIKIKPFDEGIISEYKNWIKSSIMVNQEISEDCQTTN